MGPARGPRRSRAPAGARGGQGRRRDRGAVARRGRRAGAGARRVAGAGRRRRCGALALELLDELDALPRPLAADEPDGLRRDPRRRPTPRPPARPVDDLATGSRAPGSAAPPAACSASRSKGSRARGSARSRRRRATGRSPAGSRPRASRPTSPSAGRGTARAGPTSLAENIDGIPEDDDLNFTMLGVALLERCGHRVRLARRREALARLPAAGPHLHGRARRDAKPARGLPPARDGDAAQPVPRVDRRAAAGRRLRLGRGRRPGRGGAHGVGGRAAQPHGQRRLRRDVHGGGARGVADRDVVRGRCADVGLSVVPRRSRLAEALRDCARAGGRARVGGGRRRARTSALRRLPLGARDQQHGARRGRAVRVRRGLLGRDRRASSRAAGTRTRTAPRSARCSARRSAPAGIERALVGAARRTGSRARCPASTGSSSTSSSGARSRWPACGRRRDDPGRAATRPARPAADRPADRRAARPGRGLDVLDAAKILAAPDDPADWPAWRASLERWRVEAAERIAYDGAAYDAPGARLDAALLRGRARLALGRAALRPRRAALHAGAVPAPTPSASSAASTGSCSGTPIP